MTPRTFLVTGSGRDIGQAIAIALGEPGGFGIIHYSHSADGAQAALDGLRTAGGDGVVVRADLSADDGIRALISKASEALAGRKLDTLVLNAADTAAVPIGGANAEVLRRLLAVNVVAPTLIVDGLSHLLSDSGSIIALSVASVRQVFSPEFAFFSATKAAIDVMVKSWAVALGTRGVRVNAIAPGVVDANFRAELLQDKGFRTLLESQTALGRPGRVADIAQVAAFLASDQARWITGQIIDASGGWKL